MHQFDRLGSLNSQEEIVKIIEKIKFDRLGGLNRNSLIALQQLKTTRTNCNYQNYQNGNCEEWMLGGGPRQDRTGLKCTLPCTVHCVHWAQCAQCTVCTVHCVLHWAHNTTFCSVAHKCTQVHTIAHNVDCIFKLNCTDVKIQCCIHLA